MKLNERLGVPAGINDQANDLYKKLLTDLDKLAVNTKVSMPKLSKDNMDGIMDIGEYDLKINDLDLKKIPFTIRLFYHKDATKPEVASAGYGNLDTKIISKNNNIVLDKSPESSILTIEVAVATSSKKKEVISEIKKILTPDTIAHELMHMYDVYKKRNSSMEDSALYSSYSQGGFPNEISELLHLLYFTTSVENAVRPTEVYHNLLNNNITKSDFRKFLKEDKVIKTFEKAEKFSLKELKDQLNNNQAAIDFLENAIDEGYRRVGKEVADEVLNILMMTILHNTMDQLKGMLNQYVGDSITISDKIDLMFSGGNAKVAKLQDEANKKFMNIISKYAKYEDNPTKYFEYLEKKINFVGSKMKRKLYKLYDMVATDNNNKGKILNWDIHTKINSRGKKNEGIVLKFDLFKNKLK